MAVDSLSETPPVVFTAAAADKVRELLQDEDDREQSLRVFVSGGGCSGFQYGFKFDKGPEEDDTVVTRNGVTLLIDSMSVQYLTGAQIDYKEGIDGAQFVIRNPNATTTCGCGNSFSV